MAQYPISHTCGHSETVNLGGKYDDRQRRAAWLASQPCLACQRTAETAAAENKAEADQLPSLIGSEKQIAWALRIREEALDALTKEREQFLTLGKRQSATEEQIATQMGRFDSAVATIKAQTQAGWWIDRRGWVRELLREAWNG